MKTAQPGHVRPAPVERTEEQARLEAFAAAVADGPCAVLVRGEPGIGKTTLWRHGVEACRARRSTLRMTRPAEEEMALPGVALSDLLGHEVARAAVAESEPFGGGRAVLDELRALAAARPLVLAIDDVQWLDSVSSRSLRYALRRLTTEPVGVLATIREGADPGDSVLALSAALPPGRYTALDLGPLDADALRRVLAGTVESISRPTLERIHRASAGNPLYAIELARSLGGAARSGAELPLPGSIQSALARRLEELPASLAPLLQAASALGRMNLRELREILAGEPVEELVATAEREGVIVVEDDMTVRLTHPLLGSVAYAAMEPLERRALHARLAGILAEPDRRAWHVARSAEGPDAEAAALLEEAAQRAHGRRAFATAADFAGHSRRLTPHDDPDALLRRSLDEILNFARAGEVGHAFELADSLAASLPPGAGRVELLLLRSDFESDAAAIAIGHLEAALEDASGDALLQVRVLRELAFTRFVEAGDLASATEDARSALALAQRTGDGVTVAAATAALLHLGAVAGQPDLARMSWAVSRSGERSLWGGDQRLLAKQLRWAGDLARARAAMRTDGPSDAFRELYYAYELALLAWSAGELDEAARLVAQASEWASDAGDVFATALLLYPAGLVAAVQGRIRDARAVAGDILEGRPTLPSRLDVALARRVLGLASLSLGHDADAARELGEAAGILDEIGVGHPGFAGVLPDAVEALARAGDVPGAAELCARLDWQAAAVGGEWAPAVAERSRGLVLLAAGDARRAAPHLEAAAAALDAGGHRIDAARAELAYGRALLRGGKRTQAGDALAAARAHFAEMGALLWERRALEELERAAPGRAGGQLTPAECRVAAGVARGLKNREIGQALFMSVATVEAHLTRIYRKLGIASRSDLTRLVADGSVVLGEVELGEL